MTMKAPVLNEHLLDELEALIRSGRFGRAQWILRRLNLKKVSRRHACAVANFARRVNRCSISVKLLNPVVRCPPHASFKPASLSERVEYAESLRRLGAVSEASQILESVDPEEAPQALLHSALCLFSQWRYGDGIPLLEKYIEAPGLSDYARLVGLVNLASAYIHEDVEKKAHRLLCRLRLETKEKGFTLLYGNALELSAQLEFARKDYRAALDFLDQASTSLREAGEIEHLWVAKWRAVVKSFAAGKALPELYEIRTRASEAGHWETLRDCESYIARLERDSALVSKVYFGTPYPSYRRNLLESVKSWYEPPLTFVIPGKRRPKRTLDVATGFFEDGCEGVSIGQAPHRLLMLLSRDLYKPLPLVAAFSQLFPDECFNPASSPARIHQIVKRLRGTLAKAGTGIEVLESGGAYSLVLKGSTALRLSQTRTPLSTREIQLELLREKFGEGLFSVSEAIELLGASTSTAQRLLRWAVEKGRLGVSGAGPKRRYFAIHDS